MGVGKPEPRQLDGGVLLLDHPEAEECRNLGATRVKFRGRPLRSRPVWSVDILDRGVMIASVSNDQICTNQLLKSSAFAR
jgi:hypothetical protein